MGDLALLDGVLTGIFCSVRCPGDIILETYDLAKALRGAEITLIGGFQSPMEKEFLDVLLWGRVRVVICPARGILVAHAQPNGKTEVLCKQALTSRKPVLTLDSPHNAHLMALGASSFSADGLPL